MTTEPQSAGLNVAELRRLWDEAGAAHEQRRPLPERERALEAWADATYDAFPSLLTRLEAVEHAEAENAGLDLGELRQKARSMFWNIYVRENEKRLKENFGNRSSGAVEVDIGIIQTELMWAYEAGYFAVLSRLERAEAENANLMDLLEGFTPGGSEFYRDPKRCAEWVHDRLRFTRDLAIRAKKAEAENAALRERVRAETLGEAAKLCYKVAKSQVDNEDIYTGARLCVEAVRAALDPQPEDN